MGAFILVFKKFDSLLWLTELLVSFENVMKEKGFGCQATQDVESSSTIKSCIYGHAVDMTNHDSL